MTFFSKEKQGIVFWSMNEELVILERIKEGFFFFLILICEFVNQIF